MTLPSWSVLLLALALPSGALTQEFHASFGPPLPLLPRPGEAFPEGEFVFIGPTVYDITVIYPDRAQDGSVIGVSKQVRIPLGNRVSPDVGCEISQRTDGQYIYQYTVTNRSGARDDVGQWSIHLPWDQGEAAPSERWTVSRLAREIPSIVADPRAPLSQGPPRLQVSLGHPDMLTWTLAQPLREGETAGGFTIVSPFAPGLTKGYASSGPLPVPPDVPEEAKPALATIDMPEWRERSFVTIGPQYPAGFPKIGRAADAAFSLRVMANHRQLNPQSAFVQGALSLLDVLIASGGEMVLTQSQKESLESSESVAERQFGRAIRLSLEAP